MVILSHYACSLKKMFIWTTVSLSNKECILDTVLNECFFFSHSTATYVGSVFLDEHAEVEWKAFLLGFKPVKPRSIEYHTDSTYSCLKLHNLYLCFENHNLEPLI